MQEDRDGPLLLDSMFFILFYQPGMKNTQADIINQYPHTQDKTEGQMLPYYGSTLHWNFTSL